MQTVGAHTAIVVGRPITDSPPSERQVNLQGWFELRGYLRLSDSFNRNNFEWLQGTLLVGDACIAIGLNSL